jgi:hypothetical protein
VAGLPDPILDTKVGDSRMAYIYEVSFDIDSEKMNQLKIGSSLERVLGYLRTILPSEPGYVTSRALYTLESEDTTNVIFQSEWQDWEDLNRHVSSSLLEKKVLKEFEPHIKLEHLTSRTLNEIA